MALVGVNFRPSVRELRQFGWIALVGFGVIGGVLYWKGFETAPFVLWGAAVVCWLLGLVAPRALRPVFVTLMILAWPIGWVVSHVVLVIIYYIVFTFTSIVFRLIGRDPLHRQLEPAADSYWVARRQLGPKERARYFRQF